MIRATVAAPVEEDQIAGAWLVAFRLPLMMGLEPADAVSNSSELRYCTALNISALIRAPGNEAGAPFDVPLEAVPAPELPAALIPDLFRGNLCDLTISDAVVVISIGIVSEHVRRILFVSIGFPAVLFCLHVREIRSVFHRVAAVPGYSP